MLTTSQREAYRQRSAQSRLRKAAALRGDGPPPLHALNTPVLDPMTLMPERRENGIRSLSLFSGGGGLDLGFVRAGFSPIASYELLRDAAATLEKAIPGHMVFGGEDGDVRSVKWENWRGSVDIVHGGPPCQPFSSAGRQQGYADSRDGWPAFVDAVLRVSPAAFVAENVPALASAKFADYVSRMILAPPCSPCVRSGSEFPRFAGGSSSSGFDRHEQLSLSCLRCLRTGLARSQTSDCFDDASVPGRRSGCPTWGSMTCARRSDRRSPVPATRLRL
jgi:hypothetical protein